jgi:hypothetical protein
VGSWGDGSWDADDNGASVVKGGRATLVVSGAWESSVALFVRAWAAWTAL